MITPLDFFADAEMILRILLALLLGGIIGFERERHGVSAGIRTYGSIAMGACIFGLLSFLMQGADPTRIASQVATGIGFLGGGLIFRQGDYVSGLTTAATLWVTAAIGVAVSFGMYTISISSSILVFLVLYLPKLAWWKKISKKVADATK